MSSHNKKVSGVNAILRTYLGFSKDKRIQKMPLKGIGGLCFLLLYL